MFLTLASPTNAQAKEKPPTAIPASLTLDRAITLALAHNPDIRRQVQEIERTRGLIVEVRAQALPHLLATASYGQTERLAQPFGGSELQFTTGFGQQQQQPVGGRTDDIRDFSWRVSFEVRQLLYSGGQVQSALRIADQKEDTELFLLRDAVDRVVARTRAQFATVLVNKALITVNEETVRLQEDLLKDQRNRFDAGTVPKFNVLRAEVELANVTPTLIRSKNDHLLARIELARILGLDPGPGAQPSFECEGRLTDTPRTVELPRALDLAKSRRPSLKAQRQLILTEKENIQLELAGYKPRVEARAGAEARNAYRDRDLDRVVSGWFLGVTGTWNVFDGFETKGRVQQAKARMESAKINYDDALQQAELEVRQAHANLETARETIRSLQKNVEQALEALRLANERLAAGAGTQLEVLDARVALTRARVTELQSRGDYHRALAEFDRATATGTAYADKFKDPLSLLEKRAVSGVKPRK